MRGDLRRTGVPEPVIDDAVLILSELLSNACRYGRPLSCDQQGHGDVRAAWRVDAAARLTVEVTDGGGPTRPLPATPSVTSRGGRGLNIIIALAQDWGVRDGTGGEVTVWALLPTREGSASARDGVPSPRDAFATRVTLAPEISLDLPARLRADLGADLGADLAAELPNGLCAGPTRESAGLPRERARELPWDRKSGRGTGRGCDAGSDPGFADLDGPA